MEPIRRVGYVGLGSMGQAIARNVIAGGFPLTVFDVRQAPMEALSGLGATAAASPAELAATVDLVELSVVDDDQTHDVILGENGVLEGARPGTVVAIHSTVHPRTVTTCAAEAAARGVQVIDAPVSGGAAGATARRLCYMVGGDPALLERCRPVFATSGTNIFHMGPLGSAAAAKLAQQVITCIHRLAAYEGMELAERAGVNLETFRQAVHVTSAQGQIVDNWLSNYRHLDYADEAGARKLVDGFWKGLQPALALGHELGLPLPATALVQQRFPQVLGIVKEEW